MGNQNMINIDNHDKVPYYRCEICHRHVLATKDKKVIIISSDSVSPNTEHPFRFCRDCLAEIKKPTKYLSIPCIGDVIRYPVDILEPEGSTNTGTVIEVKVDNEYGLISLKVLTEIYVDIRGTCIESCRSIAKTENETTKIE